MAEGDLFTSQKLARARQRLINLGYFEHGRTPRPRPGSDQGQDHRQHRRHREAHRPLLDRRRLQLAGQLHRHPRPLAAQLPRPGLGGVPPPARRRADPAGHHRLHRALALRPAPVRRLRPLQQPAHLHATTPSNSLGGDIRFSHPFGEYSRWNAIYRVEPGPHQRRVRRARQPAASSSEEGTHCHVAHRRRRQPRHPRQRLRADPRAATRIDRAGLRGGRASATSGSCACVVHVATSSRRLVRSRVASALRAATRSAGAKDPVPLFERFYLGGANSIRSFKARQVSPADDSGTRIGGNIELLGQRRVHRPAVLRHPGRRLLRRRQRLGPGHLDRHQVRHHRSRAGGRARASAGCRPSGRSGSTTASTRTEERARTSAPSASRSVRRSRRRMAGTCASRGAECEE